MSQTPANNALLGELVSTISSFSPQTNAREHKRLRDHAIKMARSTQYGRTNQFEIDATLNGLVEKFFVLNKTDLANALDDRLQKLAGLSNKWTPEILSFLLHLSDRPVEKSDVESLKPKDPPPQETRLTWAEILADDPMSDEELWRDVRFSPDSTDDESDGLFSSVEDVQAENQSVNRDEETTLPLKSAFLTLNEDLLDSLQRAQFWRSSLDASDHGDTDQVQPKNIPELYAIRETLLMLQGLPTSLFLTSATTHNVTFTDRYVLNGVSAQLLAAIMGNLAEIGSRLARLRNWSQKSQVSPLLQSFQHAVLKRLRSFNKELAGIEYQFASPSKPLTVSLIDLHDKIRMSSRPLLQLAVLVVEKIPYEHPGQFVELELLYDAVCESQAAGDSEIYGYLAEIFFESLQSYLRPVRRWMQDGKISTNDDFFFIKENTGTPLASSIWQDRFSLRQASDGSLLAPKFLHPAGRLILNTGKSVVFLQSLGVSSLELRNTEPSLDFGTVCSSTSQSYLAPFPALFGTAFDDWIRSKYGPSSAILLQHLFNNCQLWRSMDALEEIYFAKDGTRLQELADTIFEKLDGRRMQSWNDRYLLSELIQNVFTSSDSVDPGKLSVRTVQTRSSPRSIKALSSIVIDYDLSWPVLNVINSSSIASYQKTFRFILQIYRAKHLLCQKDPGTQIDHLATSLRHRLQWFIDTLKSHFVQSVLQPSSAVLREQMAAAEDVDDMAKVHSAYTASIQSRCLLTKNLAPIYNYIISILEMAVQFTDCRRQQAGLRVREEDQSLRKSRQTPSARRARRTSGRRRYSGKADTAPSSSEDSDGDDDDGDYDADTEVLSGNEGSYVERMEKMQDEFGRLCGFVVTGLRGVSRAGGESSWEMLADRLDWAGGTR